MRTHMTSDLFTIRSNSPFRDQATSWRRSPSIGETPEWEVETLGKGSRRGEGWVLRQSTKAEIQLALRSAGTQEVGTTVLIRIGALSGQTATLAG